MIKTVFTPYAYPAPTLIALALVCACRTAVAADALPNNLPNLAEKPDKPRFKVTDRVWPEKAGEPSLCLWKDDKLAAFSITIDDNSAPDVPWWLEQSKTYNLPVTWFVITKRMTPLKNSNWGDWPLWQKVQEAGNDVESHSHTHLHIDEPGWQSVEWEYTESKKLIEANIKDHQANFLAYPGGKNTRMNDRNLAAKYYLAGRAASGHINTANQIDYFSITCSSGTVLEPQSPFHDINSLFNPKTRYYRGWMVMLYHLVTDRPYTIKILDFYKAHEKDFWGGKFGDVACYGQERDTATLTADSSTPTRIAFTLKDQMDDAKFSTPLTIKVRLPGDWKSAKGTQDGKPADLTVVEHEGTRFALVQTIPDRGQVVLTAN